MRDADPLWYKDAIIYEAHVRAFQDSDGDGIGDFRGFTRRLDHLQDLGVTAIWLLPFYPSPLKDDGYDIADYTGIHPDYGTEADFDAFIQEAHRRGMRVITELVLNHTSDQHPWFQRARRAAVGSPERDFYLWTESPGRGETPEQYKEARIIFQDFEHSNWAWDPLARAYYWHRFYSHQPDLNYHNPEVRAAMLGVVDYWLGKGVDGLRLDAVPYLFEREGTNCENLPETYEFLKALRRHVDERFADRMLLAEANQWPEDAAAYFGGGDACHMAFHFPLMPRLFMAIHTEDRFPILDILAQTPPIAESCQWALFLRNHDELTLEMVTDEERDLMNRVYARDPRARINLGIRRRLAPLMGNHRRRIELMNALLFALPGTPVLYYGDEIGMGDNIYLGDRNGVRTPMQWSHDRNAGFSRANPQQLYLPLIIDPDFHYETVNVEGQQANAHSLLWWMKRLIGQRKRFKAFGRGSLEFLHPENTKVLAFVRRFEAETILTVANLSRYVQHVDLDLSEFRGLRPVELFGRIEFPMVGDRPYFLTLGPHSFYWFSIEPGTAAVPRVPTIPIVAVEGGWEALVAGPARAGLEEALKLYLSRRHFGGRSRPLRFAEVRESVALAGAGDSAGLTLVHAEFFEGEPETILVPLALARGERAAAIARERPDWVIARLAGEPMGVVFDAAQEPGLVRALLGAIEQNAVLAGGSGQVIASSTTDLGWDPARDEPKPLEVPQRNTSVTIGTRLFLKYFRDVDEGVNPALELGYFLSRVAHFEHVPTIVGALEYRRGRGEPMTLAILEGFVPHRGSAWVTALEALAEFFGAEPDGGRGGEFEPPRGGVLDLAGAGPPTEIARAIGAYLDKARLIGRRTAGLHLALASDRERPAMAPEPLTTLAQRGLYQSFRSRAGRVFRLLKFRFGGLPEPIRAEMGELIGLQDRAFAAFRAVIDRRIVAHRTRCHGDYHLGQLLDTGDDFVIIDFEGESWRHVGERRIKRLPLVDVVGMVASFDYAADWALDLSASRAGLEPRSRAWAAWVGSAFVRAYLDEIAGAAFLPQEPEDLRTLFDALMLDHLLDNLSHEILQGDGRIAIPLRAALRQLGNGSGPEGS